MRNEHFIVEALPTLILTLKEQIKRTRRIHRPSSGIPQARENF
jgi:hypothetical protein